jgi:murein DD-endopeptidase MepM/ murein hydrolase activator NlpD
MKKFYYFSKNKLKFVEVRNFQRKFVFLVIFFSFLISFLIFGSYFVIKEFINPDAEVKTLITENNELKTQLRSYSQKFDEFTSQMDELAKINNDIRLKVNLDPLSEEDRDIGTGGRILDNISLNSSSDVNDLITTLNAQVDEINAKFSFEKNNYNEIEETFEYNQKLFDAIPAIKPTEIGRFGDRFGMRMHPILKIRRMHYGQDIVVDRGTKVYAPGGGTIEFAGRKGGHGNTIIIDHGFGYKTLYSHLQKFKVKKGQKVKRGDLIALSGSSGKLATGPHLHYEVKHNGIALNPRNFIYDDVKIFELTQTENKSQE